MTWNRREFLETSALAGAAFAAGPLSKAQAAPSNANPDAPSVQLEGRMTIVMATKYRPYTSKPAQSATTAHLGAVRSGVGVNHRGDSPLSRF